MSKSSPKCVNVLLKSYVNEQWVGGKRDLFLVGTTSHTLEDWWTTFGCFQSISLPNIPFQFLKSIAHPFFAFPISHISFSVHILILSPSTSEIMMALTKGNVLEEKYSPNRISGWSLLLESHHRRKKSFPWLRFLSTVCFSSTNIWNKILSSPSGRKFRWSHNFC